MATHVPWFRNWLQLIVLSLLFVTVMELIHLPAALLLGPMFSGILLAIFNRPVTVSKKSFATAQAVVGAMIAHAIPPSVFGRIAADWPLFISCIFSVIFASAILGWIMAKLQVFPGSTAIWGSSPGAAAAMTIMAESFGADVRLVAFMQYLRVMIVALVAVLVTRIWMGTESADHAVAAFTLFSPVRWLPFAGTLLVIAAGYLIARCVKIPSGPMLITLALGIMVEDTGLLTLELPPWLLALSYAMIGWSIGLRFTREIVCYAARALPRVLLSVLTLVAVCCGFAWLLVQFAGIDPLTAYLATSPGGADTVAIIASSSHVDISFVMAMQTGRFILVLITGPAISRFVAKRLGAQSSG
ncbi:AbrB family transcriptional regulator [Kosakonia pseudosacchari]|uniref:AbrB family transcriptional regulator n=1 Tax=Kosakonia pseudosacchari TaxID=1646340 RepID=UPI00187EC5D3|nr:AbrB family transcriptional regulator [Kosakonia pseudosacchari]QOV64020.1 AbrB family transcriptional regulator [Kosakonia pseudosacchari]